VLGAVWSLLNPVVFLVVFSFVSKMLGGAVDPYAPFLLAGLLAWNLFNVSVLNGAQSVISNANLVKKVYFPREILPLATIGAGLVHFVLQLVVVFGVLLAFRYDFIGPNLLLLPLAVVALVIFLTAMSLFLAAANVYLRDVQHLIEVFLLFWFWLTPIVYPINFAFDVLSKRSLFGINLTAVYMLNPLANVAVGFQRAIYKHLEVVDANGNVVKTLYQAPMTTYVGRLLVVIVASSALVWVAQRVFAKAQGNFAQEL